MAKDPAFLFYSGDFLTGTYLMEDAEVGRYIRLLCLQHRKGRLTKLDFFKIAKPEDTDLISKFLIDKKGLYYNEKLENEINRRVNYCESRRNNRKNHNKHTNNICNSYVERMETETETETITENKDMHACNKKAKQVLDYLNEKANKAFRYSKTSLSPIIARLKEFQKIKGYENTTDVDWFCAVIDKKCAKWLGDPKMDIYLRPETLFNKTKFEGYISEILTDLKREVNNVQHM